jgi:hypothetical protein
VGLVDEIQERLKHATTNRSRHLCPAGFEVYMSVVDRCSQRAL